MVIRILIGYGMEEEVDLFLEILYVTEDLKTSESLFVFRVISVDLSFFEFLSFDL